MPLDPSESSRTAVVTELDGGRRIDHRHTLQFNENNLRDAERLILVARFGVGYDMIDVDACTQNDIILAITPEGVRRGMAEGSLALMLALAKQLFPKSQLLREGRWQDSKQLLGCCLTDKAIGASRMSGDFMRCAWK